MVITKLTQSEEVDVHINLIFKNCYMRSRGAAVRRLIVIAVVLGSISTPVIPGNKK